MNRPPPPRRRRARTHPLVFPAQSSAQSHRVSSSDLFCLEKPLRLRVPRRPRRRRATAGIPNRASDSSERSESPSRLAVIVAPSTYDRNRAYAEEALPIQNPARLTEASDRTRPVRRRSRVGLVLPTSPADRRETRVPSNPHGVTDARSFAKSAGETPSGQNGGKTESSVSYRYRNLLFRFPSPRVCLTSFRKNKKKKKK